MIAVILLFGHETAATGNLLAGTYQMIAGVIAGFGIGVVASLMGVAGGELLIPTFVLLFGADIKPAGSLSLVVSLPTMLVGFARYSEDQSFAVLRRNRTFLLTMAAGSVVGTFIVGLLLGVARDLGIWVVMDLPEQVAHVHVVEVDPDNMVTRRHHIGVLSGLAVSRRYLCCTAAVRNQGQL